MYIRKRMTTEEGIALLQQIRNEIADSFLYLGKTTDSTATDIPWADISDLDVFLSGEFCLLEENQRGMGSNNIYAKIKATDDFVGIVTALSSFYYEVSLSEEDGAYIIYDGAFHGLGAQNVLPKCLQKFDWTGAEITSSLSDVVLTFEEYISIRKQKL